jgi:hypothetical protein
MSEIAVNENRFVPNQFGEYVGERWGKYIPADETDPERIAILSTVFDRLCVSGGFSKKAFTSWAAKKGLLYTDNHGKTSKPVKLSMGEKAKRCYVLKVLSEE